MTLLLETVWWIGMVLAVLLLIALAFPPLAVACIYVQSRVDDLYGAYVKWWSEIAREHQKRR